MFTTASTRVFRAGISVLANHKEVYERKRAENAACLVQWDVVSLGLVPTPTLGKASSSAISVCLPEAGARLRG